MSGPVLTGFQQRTADYAVRRMWEDPHPAHRFLVADEVGLGKTIVAREVIRKSLARFPRRHFDIVYLCSSQAIASQNLPKLVIGRRPAGKECRASGAKATRLTLLAVDTAGQGRTRYFAITPDTSFRIRGRTGQMRERALIFTALRSRIRTRGFEELLMLVGRSSWIGQLQWLEENRPDRRIIRAFRHAFSQDEALKEQVRALAAEAVRAAASRRPDFVRARSRLIGALRELLAEESVRALAPRGLIVVDEFQRFAALLHGGADGVQKPEQRLAHRLLTSGMTERRVLLLSATPYRLPGVTTGFGERPYDDFVGLMRFLAGPAESATLDHALAAFAAALGAAPPDPDTVMAARNEAQAILRRVMSRTERTSFTSSADGMVDDAVIELDCRPEDLRAGVGARRLARRLGVHDPLEYWKSAPFALEFMRGYRFRAAAEACEGALRRKVAREAAAVDLLLDLPRMRRFGPIALPNPRLRHIVREGLPDGAERLLWVPPSLPYLAPEGVFAGAPDGLKRLLFTEWRLAPDAISTLVSYEAERRLEDQYRKSRFGAKLRRRPPDRRHQDFAKAGELLRLIRKARTDQESGIVHTSLAMLVPAGELGRLADPLPFALRAGQPVAQEAMLREARRAITRALKSLQRGATGGRADERWYWAAPLLLDKRAARQWLNQKDPFFLGDLREGPRALDVATIRRAIEDVIEERSPLGRRPRRLADDLARIALTAPGVCALRALRRVFPEAAAEAAAWRSAFRIARGLQTLFNQPDATAAVQTAHPRLAAYWRQALEYCLDGNLQALLDEQLHLDGEALDMSEEPLAKKVAAVSRPLHDALSIRRASLDVEGLDRRQRRRGTQSTGRGSGLRLRGRYALRFAEIKEADGAVSRLDAVRAAFNSPFRPFILASTAVGQEGLDFHPWCHIVVHWNLPRSPVEMEQREGRVHRYKGHAVRLNVAAKIGLAGLAAARLPIQDAWRALFDLARDVDRSSDLAPCWLFDSGEGAKRIQRVVPVLRWSREAEFWPKLRNSLATYRLVLGLPRQEDLLVTLERNGITSEQARAWRIDLAPP